jgi:glycosyltransferase 2 family protein
MGLRGQQLTPRTACVNRAHVRTLIRLVAAILTLLIIAALVKSLRRDGPAALEAWRAAEISWSWICAAMACGLAGFMLSIIGWQRLLIDCGVVASSWLVSRIFLLSNLGRYLPGGKAWQMSIVSIMATENGLSAPIVAVTSLFQGLVGVAVGMALLVITGGVVLRLPTALLLLPTAGLVLLIALPSLLHRVPTLRVRLLERVPALATVTGGTMWSLVWTGLVSWLAWGMGLYCLARGLDVAGDLSVVACIAAWAGPFIAGLIAFVAPAGIGVRDELMRNMLVASGATAGGAAILAVIARVWITILEVVPALLLLALRQRAAGTAAATPAES